MILTINSSFLKLKKVDLLLLLFIIGLYITEYQTDSKTIYLYGYALSLFSCLILFFSSQKLNKNQFLLFVLFFLLFIVYLPINPAGVDTQFKLLVMIIIPAIIIPWSTNLDIFASKFVLITSNFLFLFLILFLVGIGADYSYGTNGRMQGLVSEPSALALLTSIALIYFIKKPLIIIPIASIYLSGSPTVLVVSLLSLILFKTMELKRSSHKIIFISILITLLFMNYAFLSAIDSENIHINRFINGINNIVTIGESGYNPRMNDTINAISFLQDNNHFYFGLGINSAAILSGNIDGGRALSLPFEILFSFGIIGLFFYLTLLIKIMINSQIYPIETRILISCVISYTFVNSAQGVIFQVIAMLILIFIFLSPNKPHH